MFKTFKVCYSAEGNLTVLEKVWGIFGLRRMETQRHGRKEIKPMHQEKKTHRCRQCYCKNSVFLISFCSPMS